MGVQPADRRVGEWWNDETETVRSAIGGSAISGLSGQ